MVSINYAFKEIFSKIVYYGPGLSGKTTNLQYVFKKAPKETRGELISLATDADRTLYFDFLPVNVGEIKGFAVKFQLYTVPGQVYYNATRKLVLRGVDGLVFVADSQVEKMDDNIESLKNLEENLAEYGYNLRDLPFVLQYNKRDLPNIATVEQMNKTMNSFNVPYFEAVASMGDGVFATLKAISKLVMEKAKKGGMESSRSAVVDPGSSTVGESKPQPAEPIVSSPEKSLPEQSLPETISSTTSDQAVEIAQQSKTEVLTADKNPKKQQPVEVLQMRNSEVEETAEQMSEVVESPEVDTETKLIEKPSIVTESENLTNVVVSTTEDDVEKADDDIEPAGFEEATEHSELKNDESEPEEDKVKIKKHPDVLDADRLREFYSSRSKELTADEPVTESDFDEEETVIADPKQTGHMMMGKPQMAESKKVKDKKKAGLFGGLKKKKK